MGCPLREHPYYYLTKNFCPYIVDNFYITNMGIVYTVYIIRPGTSGLFHGFHYRPVVKGKAFGFAPLTLDSLAFIMSQGKKSLFLFLLL